MHRLAALAVASIAAATFASHSYASDPFSLTAQTTDSSNVHANASGHNLVDLAGNLINSEDQFTSLSGHDFAGNLRYGGVKNAVLFSRNAAGTSATIKLPTTGFSRTFTASNEHDLEDQIRDFFKKDGASEYASFLKSINELSTLGVSDGNPLATTAFMANSSFYRFGFQSPRFDTGQGARIGGFEIDAAAGAFNTAEADGYFASAGIANTFRLADNIGFSIGLDSQYRSIDGAAVYQFVNTDALPVQIIAPGVDGGLSWTLTPAFVIGFGGSWDLAAGGVPIGGQITSSLGYQIGGWTFVLADQYGYYGGLPISFSDFRFDTDVDQQVLKNGVQIIRSFGNFFIDAGVSYTNFLKDAAVEHYWTPEAGVGLRFGENSGVRIGYRGDFGPGYQAEGGDVSLFLTF